MCGIIGFTGRLEAQKILTEGLAALEYRGYDSAGIAYFKDTGKISIRKTVGKVKDLLAIPLDRRNTILLQIRIAAGVESDIQDGQHTAELPMPMLILTRLEMSHSSTMVSLRTTTRS